MDFTQISDRRRALEITAVLLTAAGKFVFMDLINGRLPFILAVIIGWGAYIIYRNKSQEGILQYWGFRTDNFRAVAKRVLPYALAAVFVFFAIGIYQGTIHISWTIIPVLVLYPLWGMIQQFLLIALTAGNLQHMGRKNLHHAIIITSTALLFGLIHYPYTWLMIGTFVLALFYGYIYLRERNIYVLGLFHGWLGALFYYTIMDRDPFLELFDKFS
jgi:membrane protease YdiL (CAAX protease family)